MKKAKKGVLVFFIAVAVFLFVFGCDNAEKAATPSQQTVDNFGEMMGAVFSSEVMEYADPTDPIPGTYPGSGCTVTVAGDQSSGTITVVFTNYEDYYYDITINGTMTITYSYSGTSGTFTISGALTFTGTDASVSTVSFDVTLSATNMDTSESTVTVSGTITVDGVKYVASAFGLEDVFD